MYSIKDLANEIINHYQKENKYYTDIEFIKTQIRKYIRLHPNKNEHRKQISSVYYYDEEFKISCIKNIKLDNLPLMTREKMFEYKLDEIRRWDAFYHNGSKYATLDNIMKLLNIKYPTEYINYHNILENHDIELNMLFVCKEYTNKKILNLEKTYPIGETLQLVEKTIKKHMLYNNLM